MTLFHDQDATSRLTTVEALSVLSSTSICTLLFLSCTYKLLAPITTSVEIVPSNMSCMSSISVYLPLYHVHRLFSLKHIGTNEN